MPEVARLEAVVTADTAAAEQSLNRFSDTLDKKASEIGRAGTTLTAAFTLPFVALGKSAFDATADYQKNMALFQSVTKASGEQIAAVGDLAKALGADLTLPATSAGDAAAAMTELAKAGLSVDQAMAAAKGVLQLSAAAGVDNARAAEIAANALNAFRLPGEKAADVANLLANAANASSIEITDAADSLKMASAVFSAFQGSVVGPEQALKDLTVSIGLLGNQGIKGSDAGTSLKQALLQLTGPSQKAKAEMQGLFLAAQGAAIGQEDLTKLLYGGAKAQHAALEAIREGNAGLQMQGDIAFDAAGQMRPWKDIIKLTSLATKDMSDEMRDAALTTIFGADATRAIIALMQQGEEGWDSMTAAIEREGGAAALANARMVGVGGALEGLKSQFETTALTIGEMFAPAVESALRGLADMVQGIGQLPAPLLMTVTVIGAFLAVIGPLALAFSGILAVASAVATMFGALGAAFGALAVVGPAVVAGIGAIAALLTGPIIIAIVAVIAIVALLTAAWVNNWGDIQGKTAAVVQWLQGVPGMLSDAWQKIQDGWKRLAQAASTTWTGITSTIGTFVQNARSTIQTFLTTVQTAWQTGWAAITTFIRGAMETIRTIFVIALGAWYVLFVERWVLLAQATYEKWTEISTWLQETFWNPLTTFIGTKLAEILTAITTKWTEIQTATTTTWSAISTWFMETFWNPLVTFITTTVQTIFTTISTKWTEIKDKTVEIWTAISTWFADTFWNPLVTFVTEKSAAIWTAVTTKWSEIQTKTTEVWNAIKQFLSELWDGIKTTATDTWNAISKSITDIISSLADSVGKAGGEMMTAFFDGLKEKGEKVLDWVGDFVKNILDKFKGVEGLDEHSPSKALFDIGVNAGEGFRRGLASTMSSISSTVGGMVGAVTGGFGATTATSGPQRYFSEVGRPMTDNIRDYIAGAAELRGMSPSTALRVAMSEGGVSNPALLGDFSGPPWFSGKSWWPFQLHYGGAGTPYAAWGGSAGLGNSFTALTNWAPGDPAAWKDSVDYALDIAKRQGWSQWYGAAASGIGNWEGIGRARGGPIGANMDYIVGERGPERIRLSRSATVLPTPGSDLQSGGGITYAPTFVVNDSGEQIAAFERYVRKQNILRGGWSFAGAHR